MIVTNGRRLMERMDRAPYDFVLNASERELGALAGFVHRTFNDGDCIDFIRALRPFYAHSVRRIILQAFHDLHSLPSDCPPNP